MLENFNQKIETPDIIDHENELGKRLSMVMLAFAEKKYLAEKEINPEIKISDIIEANTDLFFSLENVMLYERNLSPNEIATWKDNFKQKIDAIYEQSGDWMLLVRNLFNEETEKYQTPRENQTPKEFAGAINYNLRQGGHGLEEYGFDRNLDQALEIHLEQLFKHPDKKLTTREILDSFSKLAEIIVDKFPQVKLIIAESWLMDHPLFKKLGFQMTDKASDLRTASHWLQFVDKDGQIDKKKVDELLQTGEFAYQSRVAYFPIIDFLTRYLPAERKGKPIILKDIKPGFKESGIDIEAEGKKFSQAWLKLKIEDLDKFKESFPLLTTLMEKLGLFDEFIASMKRMKERGDDWGQGRAKEIDFFNKFEQRRNEYIQKEGVIEKEIIIN